VGTKEATETMRHLVRIADALKINVLNTKTSSASEGKSPPWPLMREALTWVHSSPNMFTFLTCIQSQELSLLMSTAKYSN